MTAKYKWRVADGTVDLVSLIGVVGDKALWWRTFWTLVKLSIRITKFNRNITNKLLLVTHSLYNQK